MHQLRVRLDPYDTDSSESEDEEDFPEEEVSSGRKRKFSDESPTPVPASEHPSLISTHQPSVITTAESTWKRVREKKNVIDYVTTDVWPRSRLAVLKRTAREFIIASLNYRAAYDSRRFVARYLRLMQFFCFEGFNGKFGLSSCSLDVLFFFFVSRAVLYSWFVYCLPCARRECRRLLYNIVCFIVFLIKNKFCRDLSRRLVLIPLSSSYHDAQLQSSKKKWLIFVTNAIVYKHYYQIYQDKARFQQVNYHPNIPSFRRQWFTSRPGLIINFFHHHVYFYLHPVFSYQWLTNICMLPQKNEENVRRWIPKIRKYEQS